MDEILEKKLREMVDRHEILQVLTRYGRGLDRVDNELLRSCYFEDCIEDHGSFVGSVEDFIKWTNASSATFVTQHHNILNHSCELDGDNAHTETYYLFIGELPKPPHLVSIGRYLDHFQRRNGEWRFANRVTLIESTFGLSDHDAAAMHPSSYPPSEAQPMTKDRTDASYHRPIRPRQPRPMKQWPAI